MKYRIYIVVILVLLILYIALKNYTGSTESEAPLMMKSPTEPEATVDIPTVEKFKNNMPILKLYYTNWCEWSKRFFPTWDRLTETVKSVSFEKLDCEKQKCENIPGFPFIVLEKNGKNINYNGDRSYNDIVKFINSNKNRLKINY